MRRDKGKPRGHTPYMALKLRQYRERVRQEAADSLEQRMRNAKCRRLMGAEFEARAAELEAADRAERARMAE